MKNNCQKKILQKENILPCGSQLCTAQMKTSLYDTDKLLVFNICGVGELDSQQSMIFPQVAA